LYTATGEECHVESKDARRCRENGRYLEEKDRGRGRDTRRSKQRSDLVGVVLRCVWRAQIRAETSDGEDDEKNEDPSGRIEAGEAKERASSAGAGEARPGERPQGRPVEVKGEEDDIGEVRMVE
jgi:hypothetical protein